MSEDLLIYHCAPTLANLKTGSLFSCQYDAVEKLKEEIRYFNRLLGPKGIRILPLQYKKGRALIYLYRPMRLEQDFADQNRCHLLAERGYREADAAHCIIELIRRLRLENQFPHEIGLFLGYPTEDVAGFIRNQAGGSKMIGYWKVYGDEEKARHLFLRYKKCTDAYCRQRARGKSIVQLTVPNRKDAKELFAG